MKGTRTVVIRLGAIGRSPMLDLGLVVIAAIAFLDWWTGVEVNPEIFYVIPVALAAWFSGRDLAMALSGVSALGW
ncbi:MAG: hypothetical protein HY900_22090, partial [Deltaproteobacteria bacterium]|nr:hypothetical protein [Deltaproteobacteria bacterium]